MKLKMRVEIRTDKKYHHDDGLLNGLVVDVELMAKDNQNGDCYKAIGIDHRYYLREDDFVELK